MSLLLDTHAALWLVQGDDRLSRAALSRLQELARDEICISDLLLFELGLLITKRRVVVDEPLGSFLNDFAAHFHVLPVDAVIATAAAELALPQGDPFDRIFVATAVRHALPLVTRDKEIRDSELVPTIW